jgi:hypothetical protein
VSAAAPVVSTGSIDRERAIARLRAVSSEAPPVRRLFAESGRCRAGLPELEVR